MATFDKQRKRRMQETQIGLVREFGDKQKKISA